MTANETNPFQELYVTDSPDARAFVALFSSVPVRFALALFKPGHVVLRGTQGSGKSMLLNLFRPQIRLAYSEADAEFPVPERLRCFVGAGINLTRSGALDIGNRPLSDDRQRDEMLFPLYFADFLNYYVVRDILRTVETMQQHPREFGDTVRANALDSFARVLAHQSCWFGALDDCTGFEELCKSLDDRISAYRAFHLYNSAALPSDVERTKTSIGEPIARTADLLRTQSVLPPDTPVFVRIDQVERLYRSDVLRPGVGHQYRRIVNKAIGLRDSRVWYRVGTRQYAWDDDLLVYGTDDRLEHLRDYRVIDLDELLRRREDPKTWVFPAFAEDAFSRRLKHAGYAGAEGRDLIGRVFGTVEDASEVAREYAKGSSAERALKLDSLPKMWVDFLGELFREDPLSGMLAAAWCRQGGAPRTGVARWHHAPPATSQPWKREYWRKERIRQALMQLAARSAQRLKWAGKDHLLTLSAGNISILLSICHEVWDAFLRAQRRRTDRTRQDPIRDGIHKDIQAVGIQTASVYWYEKVVEQPNGDDRRRFLDVIAASFRKQMLSDDAMSYPGRNGFSVSSEDLKRSPDLQAFLREAADYGDLYEVQHTTKERDRRRRRKWYICPVLSVHYQIPESHVKEPIYATVETIREWLREAQIPLSSGPGQSQPKQRSRIRPEPEQSLFDELDEE